VAECLQAPNSATCSRVRGNRCTGRRHDKRFRPPNGVSQLRACRGGLRVGRRSTRGLARGGQSARGSQSRAARFRRAARLTVTHQYGLIGSPNMERHTRRKTSNASSGIFSSRSNNRDYALFAPSFQRTRPCSFPRPRPLCWAESRAVRKSSERSRRSSTPTSSIGSPTGAPCPAGPADSGGGRTRRRHISIGQRNRAPAAYVGPEACRRRMENRALPWMVVGQSALTSSTAGQPSATGGRERAVAIASFECDPRMRE
jgi:hypothetical protein